MEAKEEIRARLSIEDVIGQYVELKRAGRNFKGLSPFNQERTPSFIVSPEKQIWYDFSSNRGGDIFAFVMQVEGMDFRQALEFLARKAGVDLLQYQSKKVQQKAVFVKKTIQAHELAARFYQFKMTKNKRALEYIFQKRSLSKKVVQEFLIGYADDSQNTLLNYLTKKGFTKSELSNMGLLNRYGGDLFRDRMMVPLMNSTGQVIGFTGRVLNNQNNPKYLNTPQTDAYDKSGHVFGLSQAKEAIRSCGYVVIVEGNLDVVSSHKVDVRQVVATAGTAMTEYHIKELKRFTSDIRLAYDADDAGLKAAERAIEIASNQGVDLTIVSMVENAKDPDELIQKDVKLWEQVIDDAKPAVDWVLEQYSKNLDIQSAIEKSKFADKGLDVIKNFDAVQKDHYKKKIASIVKTDVKNIDELAKRHKVKPVMKKIIKNDKIDSDKHNEIFDNFLALLFLVPRLVNENKKPELDVFPTENRKELYDFLQKKKDMSEVEQKLHLQKISEYVKMIAIRAETQYCKIDIEKAKNEYHRILQLIEKKYAQDKMTQLIEDLRIAEENEDDEKASELRIELNKIIKRS